MSENNATAVVPVSAQAKLLSCFLKDKGLAQLTHSQALEALAHAQNCKSYNVLRSKKSVASASSPQELLRQAIAAGLTSGEALNVFAESRTEEEAGYLEAAREEYGREGELEFDDNAVISVSEDGGAYVMGWRWVYDRETSMPKDLAQALRYRFENVSVMLEDQDVDDDFEPHELTFNEEALAQYVAGEDLPDDTWLVRGCNSEEAQRFEMTVRHFKALSYNTEEELFEGSLGNNALRLTLNRT